MKLREPVLKQQGLNNPLFHLMHEIMTCTVQIFTIALFKTWQFLKLIFSKYLFSQSRKDNLTGICSTVMIFSGVVALRELSWIRIEIFEMFNLREVMNQYVTTFLFTNFRPTTASIPFII